jgi:UDP-N-acetyl-D-mannosaminuronic acid dehydrogenase
MYDITIIGAGRVGLPLALMFESKGFKVSIKDKDEKILAAFKKKKMPFKEAGFDKLIKKTKIKAYKNEMPESLAYVITVGTPLNQNIETDLSQVNGVIDELVRKINLKGKIVILRSTVAPYTTEYVRDYITEKTNLIAGDDFFLANCPERIAEGVAFKELTELPQIVGVQDDNSYKKVKDIFKKLVGEKKVLRSSFLEAELAKLFSNIYRYINFAIPNYFLVLAHNFGVESMHLFEIMNKGYKRNKSLKSPGLTAGTCLRKDFGMINENYFQTDLILQAYKINEFMPKFITDVVKGELRGKKVGILGYTFKANSDDVRDTLVAKLIGYIRRCFPKEIKISDYNLPLGKFIDNRNNMMFSNIAAQKLITSSDVIFIAINHSDYYKIPKKEFSGKTVIDLWKVIDKGLVARL